MATPATRPRAVRRQIPYTTTFRNFSPAQRGEELAELKKMYEDDGLSIRRVAKVKTSTYGFIRARLLDAGVDISANQKGKQPKTGDQSGSAVPEPRSHRQ
jgi:hypothetical protein